MLPRDLTSKLEGVRDLPSPPKLAKELIELAEDPEVTLAAIGGLIEKDPALATKLLRVANSSLYSRGRTRETVRQAILALGLNGTLTLALSFSLVASMRENDGPGGIDLQRYWQRSLMAANGARALAESAALSCTEQVFLAAMLQDIGVLVLDRAIPGFYDQAPDVLEDHAGLILHEQGAVHCHHALVGEWLLDRWHLAEPICYAVGASHGVDFIPNDYEHADLARCVALSGDLADVWFMAQPHEALSTLAAAAERHLNVGTHDLLDIFVGLREQLPETEALFELSILSGDDAERIMAKANELLSSTGTPSEGASKNVPPAELQARLDREFPVAERERWPLSVALIGFSEGLDGTAAAAAAAHHLGDTAALSYLGDDRLMIVFSGASGDEAEQTTRTLLLRLSSLGEALSARFKVGVATLDVDHPYASANNLVRAAAGALHQAMRSPDKIVEHANAGDDAIPLENPSIEDFMTALGS